MPSVASALSASPSSGAACERRGAARYDVSVTVEVTTADGLPLSSEVTNISASGFRARSAMQLGKGAKIVVRFANGRRRRAYVAWQIGEDVGCRLLRPLTADELAEVIEG